MIDLKCSICDAPLKAKFIIDKDNGNIDATVEPCKNCLSDANAEGYADGQES